MPHRPDSLIESLYSSVESIDAFSGFMGRMVNHLGGHIAALQFEDLAHRKGRVAIVVGVDAEELSGYEARYSADNLWIQRGAASLIETGFVDSDRVASASEMARTEFHAGVLKPLDIGHSVGWCLNHGPRGQISALSMNRSARMGSFGDDIAGFAQWIHPHLKNAYTLMREFDWLNGAQQSISSAVDALRCALFVLRPSGQVAWRNAAAEEWLRTSDAVELAAGAALQLAHVPDQARLDRAIALCLAHPQRIARVAIRNRARQVVGIASLMSVACTRWVPGMPHDRAVTVLLHRREAPPVAADQIAATLGLTPAEARAALALGAHASTREAAAALGVTYETLRGQIKSCMTKTGARSQSQLLLRIQQQLARQTHPQRRR